MPVIRFFLLHEADPAIQVLSPVKYVVWSAQLCTRKGFRTVEVTKSKGRNSSCKTKYLEVKELLPEAFLAGAGGRGSCAGAGHTAELWLRNTDLGGSRRPSKGFECVKLKHGAAPPGLVILMSLYRERSHAGVEGCSGHMGFSWRLLCAGTHTGHPWAPLWWWLPSPPGKQWVPPDLKMLHLNENSQWCCLGGYFWVVHQRSSSSNK